MLSFVYLPVLVLTASIVSALVVPRESKAPADWATDQLENYDVFHHRYLSLDCYTKHDTPFFEQCCHPLRKDENLNDRPAQCTPPPTSDQQTPSYPPNEVNGSCHKDGGDGDDIPNSEAPPTSEPYDEPVMDEKAAAPGTGAVVALANVADASVQYGGYATFYYQNGNAGACGQYHSDGDYIAAMDYRRYGDTSRRSGLCGKRVRITNTKNGKTVTVTIADACPTCKNSNSIDLSVAAFKAIATVSEGIVPIKWQFV